MKRTPKNFAIWTALNSDVIYFFASGPSYYGGCQQDQDQRSEQKLFITQHEIHTEYGYASVQDMLKTVLKIGINWDASSLPQSDQVAEFQGTFCDAEYKDIVRGVLVLVDDTEIEYYAECKLNMDQFATMQLFFDQSTKE